MCGSMVLHVTLCPVYMVVTREVLLDSGTEKENEILGRDSKNLNVYIKEEHQDQTSQSQIN